MSYDPHNTDGEPAMTRRVPDTETQALLDAHVAYLRVCECKGLTPLEINDFIFQMALSALGPKMILYRSPVGSIWVHNIKHKTKRKDVPFAIANFEAMR